MFRVIDDRYITTGLFPPTRSSAVKQAKKLLSHYLSSYIKQYFPGSFQISKVKPDLRGIKGFFSSKRRSYAFFISDSGDFKYVEQELQKRLDARSSRKARKKQCQTGKSCKNSCIAKGKVCRGKLTQFSRSDFADVKNALQGGKNKAWGKVGATLLALYATKQIIKHLAKHLANKKFDSDIAQRLAAQKKQKSTIGEQTLERKVRKAESKIRNNDFETLILFDPKTGKEIGSFEGDENSVKIQDYQTTLIMAGSIATHNHPGQNNNSFSDQDIKTAMIFQLQEMRVVGRGYRYTLKPPKEGWNRRFYDRVWQKEYKKQVATQLTKYRNLYYSGKISLEEAEHQFLDDTVRLTSEATGVSYSKQKYRDRIGITTGGRYAA